MVVDFIVVIVTFFVYGVTVGLFSLAGFLAKSFFIDTVIETLNLCKYFTIISKNAEPICNYINTELNHGATIYEARGFDTVILSMGFSSRYTHRDGQNVVYDFAEELKDIVPEVHMVGDAVRARRALDATKEAYEVALNL